jgi:hypothetical protein
MYPYQAVAPSDTQHIFRDIEENGYTSLLGFEWADWKERGVEALVASLKETTRLISGAINEDVEEAKAKGFEVRPIILVLGNDGDFTSEQEEAIFTAGGIFHDRAGDTREGGIILTELIQAAHQTHLNDDCRGGSCGCGSGGCGNC